jgi:hypothetical protein
MATPNYKGQGQPGASSGGWLGSLIGGGPAYIGAGQPGSKSSYAAGSSPSYKPAPVAAPVPTPLAPDSATSETDQNACGPAQFAIVIPRQLIQPEYPQE